MGPRPVDLRVRRLVPQVRANLATSHVGTVPSSVRWRLRRNSLGAVQRLAGETLHDATGPVPTRPIRCAT